MRIDRYELERYVIKNRGGLVSWAGLSAAAIALLLGAIWFVAWRPRKPPSIFDAPVDNIASFFASPDFNALPPRERLELIAQFVQRFRSLEQSESAVLSAFLAGLTGKSREQLRENVRILAKDLLKEGADEYLSLPPDQRGEYLDEWVIGWIKFGERIDRGEERNITDEQRLAELRRDGQRDRDRASARVVNRSFDQDDAVRFLDLWKSEVESTASPKEQGQIFRFMTDLRDRLTNPPG